MAAPSPVRLLIADASQNRAHEIDSLLRDAGIVTRPEFYADLDSAVAEVPARHPDLMLCTGEFDRLESLLPGLRERHPDLPVIVLTPGAEPRSLTQGMALGATDVVFEDDRERLLYVIRRELHYVSQRHYLCETRRALDEAERRCRLLLENSTTAIAYVHEGMHIHANDDYLTLFGFEDLDDLVGLPLLDLIDADFAAAFKAQMKAFRTSGNELSFEFTGRTVDGSPLTAELTLVPAEYEGEACTQVLVRQRAATANGAAHPALDEVPDAPPSAGVHSLDAFAEQVEGTLGRAGSLAVYALAIDDFHELQAAHGLRFSEHLVGAVEHCVSDAVQSAVVTRVGEHTFAVAVATSGAAATEAMAEDMRKAVEITMFDVSGKTVRCTITLGAINLPQGAQALTGLDLAFRSMINGRLNGGANQMHWYKADAGGNTGSVDSGGDRNTMLERIHHAIDNNRFKLLYQPTISLRGDSDEHYEVFLRMLDDHDNQIRPDHFLQIAIDNGVALKIDRWVILQAIKELSGHRAKGHDTRITINLTSNSLRDAEFQQWLGVAIKAARLPSDAIIFQFAETDAALYLRQTKAFVEGLHALHCRASLSRFGTSKNAFDTLQHVPVDFVKIDGALVQNVDQNAERRKQLTEMISELQARGKLTVVPMVESANELSALWQAGANYIQGNYLQEPSAEMSYDFASDD